MEDSYCVQCKSFKAAVADSDLFRAEVEDSDLHQRLNFPLAPDILELQRSASSGCPMCQLVYHCCIQDVPPSKLSSQPIELWFELFEFGPVVGCKLGESTFSFDLDDSTPEALTFGKQIADLSSSEGVQAIAQRTKQWIENCKMHHDTCNYHQHKAQALPTRIIDVGEDRGKQSPHLLVPDSRFWTVEKQYAALSYAWGPNSHFVKTTASNLDQMKDSLPWDGLPKTIQDAIEFTQKIGIRYLWVDSLCILQSEGPNDESHNVDWSREASRFGQYYQNATLTIAATGAESSDQGLFLERCFHKFELRPCLLRSTSNAARILFVMPTIPEWIRDVSHSPLLERGWAIQERLLSKKIVHFGRNLVLWECLDLQEDEVSPIEESSQYLIYKVTSERFLEAFKGIRGTKTDYINSQWISFVE
ncbi:hypothetical protein FDECE_18351 [Fusarium decemcellulare]|nr:hypothetical protein FDECE_18351 [Fusarium decemcellulare]